MTRLIEKRELSQDARGFFRWYGGRQCRYGQDRATATLANAKIGLLWQRLASRGETWTDTTWAIANALRKGERSITIPPNPDMVGAESYVHWIDRHRLLAGDLLDIVPTEPAIYQTGAAETGAARERHLAWLEMAYPQPVARENPSETLHRALDAYIEHLRTRELDDTGTGRVRVKRAEFIRQHLADLPLSRLTLAQMEEHLTYFARRPASKLKSKQPISKDFASDIMGRLRDFWRWLDRSDLFHWTRPAGHDELKPRVVTLAADHAKRMKARRHDTYTVEELTALYTAACPMMRAYLLLGLNCGFAREEFATLRASEIDFAKNRIERNRHKTGAYAEWTLWAPTVQALRWAIARKQHIGGQSEYLMVSEQGTPLNGLTPAGHKCNRIPNLWNHLLNKVERRHPGFKRLPPKSLRKIGSTMIRNLADGEIMALYLAHTETVATDKLAEAYSNHPWHKLHAALAEMEKLLTPMFNAVESPFPEQGARAPAGRTPKPVPFSG